MSQGRVLFFVRNSPKAVAIRLGVAFLLHIPASLGASSYDPAEKCDAAAHRASKEANVPLDVLRAITRTETGRGGAGQLKPWPWTVNMEGQGVWFDTEAEARSFVFRHFKAGSRNFDVGCFQINYRWHGAEFSSIESMFDPTSNANYAAKFLAKLRRELGSWEKAVGAYHSRTQKYATRYIERYISVKSNLAPAIANSESMVSQQIYPTVNRGSLVPLRSTPSLSLFAPAKGG
jgi:hypothetical protein